MNFPSPTFQSTITVSEKSYNQFSSSLEIKLNAKLSIDDGIKKISAPVGQKMGGSGISHIDVEFLH